MATIAQLRCAQVSSSTIANANPLEGRKSGLSNGGFVDFKGKFSAVPLFAQTIYSRGDGGARKLSRLRCALAEPKTKVEKKTILHELYEQQGQSPWYDNLRRPVTDLIPLIESGVRGITSNPTIFERAIISSDAYDDQFRFGVFRIVKCCFQKTETPVKCFGGAFLAFPIHIRLRNNEWCSGPLITQLSPPFMSKERKSEYKRKHSTDRIKWYLECKEETSLSWM